MATPVLVNGYTGVQATAIWVRGQSCDVMGYHIYNASNATAFVQFYDSGPNQGAPTVGTTVAKWLVPVPTVSSVFMPISPTAGLYFENGLYIAATTTASGNTNPSAVLTIAVAVS
jgi:hypothetical protein